MTRPIAEAVAALVRVYDPELERHQRVTANYAAGFARSLGWRGPDVRDIQLAALMHDLGKLAVMRSVLRKPAPLTTSEKRLVREHPVIGEAAVRKFAPKHPRVALWVRHHHEHYDGNGYPDGLKGGSIPEGARLLAIVDAFDTMVYAQRGYKSKNRTVKSALAEIRRHAGRQFDPLLAEKFCRWIEDNPEVVEIC